MRVCARSQITRIACRHFVAEFDGERFAKRERATGRMVHENAGRVRGYSLLHLFHCLALFLTRCAFANAEARKNIKSGLVTDTALIAQAPLSDLESD